MAKSNKSNADNYREPVPADYALDYKGYTCQLHVHRDIKLYHEEYGEKSSPFSTKLKEGMVIPAYDNQRDKEGTEIGK